MQKKLKKDWNLCIWVLIWEHPVKVIQWIPTWQGLDGYQKMLHPCALDESSLRIGNVERIGEFQPFSFMTFISNRIMIFDSCDTQFSTQLLWDLNVKPFTVKPLLPSVPHPSPPDACVVEGIFCRLKICILVHCHAWIPLEWS